MFRQDPNDIQGVYSTYQKLPSKPLLSRQAPHQEETPLLKEVGLLQEPLLEDTFQTHAPKESPPPTDISALDRLQSFLYARAEAKKIAKETYHAKGKEWAFQQQQLATQQAINIGLERLAMQNEELAQLKADINNLSVYYAAQELLHDNKLYPRDKSIPRKRNNSAKLALQTSPFLIKPCSINDFDWPIEAMFDGSFVSDKSSPPSTLDSLPPEKASLVLEYKHNMRQLKSEIEPLRKSYFEKLEAVHREQALLESLMQDNN